MGKMVARPVWREIEINEKKYRLLKPLHELNARLVEIGELAKKVVADSSDTKGVIEMLRASDEYIVSAIGMQAVKEISDGIPADVEFVQNLYQAIAEQVIELVEAEGKKK